MKDEKELTIQKTKKPNPAPFAAGRRKSSEMNSLDKVRKSVKASIQETEFELPMDAAFYDKLHDSIMAKVAETAIEAAPALLKPKRFLRAHWREWIYPTGAVLSLVLIATLVLMQAGNLNLLPVQSEMGLALAPLNASGEKVVAAVMESNDLLDLALVSSQTEADFFVDVASQSFENLNVSQLNKIMGEHGLKQR